MVTISSTIQFGTRCLSISVSFHVMLNSVLYISGILDVCLQDKVRSMRVVEDPRDSGTSGCQTVSERFSRKKVYEDIMTKSKTVNVERGIELLPRKAFIAHYRNRLGWSKASSKKEWAKKDMDPDVATNGLKGHEKTIAVQLPTCIRGISARTLTQKFTKKTDCEEDDEGMRLFNRDNAANLTDNFFAPIECADALKQGGASLAISDLQDDRDESSSGDESDHKAKKRPRAATTRGNPTRLLDND